VQGGRYYNVYIPAILKKRQPSVADYDKKVTGAVLADSLSQYDISEY
jgi:hypothetical protein